MYKLRDLTLGSTSDRFDTVGHGRNRPRWQNAQRLRRIDARGASDGRGLCFFEHGEHALRFGIAWVKPLPFAQHLARRIGLGEGKLHRRQPPQAGNISAAGIVSGLQIIASRLLDARRTFVIGLSFVIAIAVEVSPAYFRALPASIQPLFGSSLARKANIQDWVAEARAQIHAARLMTLHAAWTIDTAGPGGAREEIALIKFFGAQVLHDVVDRAIQVHGAAGVTEDHPLSMFYRQARLARLYDGPDEVHKMTVARRILARYAAQR